MAKGKGSSLGKMMKTEAKMDKKSGDKNISKKESSLEKAITKKGGKK